MRPAIATFLLIVFLLSSTQFNQLLKLPKLVEHYLEHKSENKTLSVWQFLYLHYGQGEVHDKDYEEDMKLPFKTQSVCNTQGIVHKPGSLVFKAPAFVLAGKKINAYDVTEFIATNTMDNIWRPPQSLTSEG